ncbi:helix-turn-helix domain-containing protein [Desulfosporosinus meridiei]|nr:helix-turn-helix transcriptional regulator [Desulfosporosinus meridiei]
MGQNIKANKSIGDNIRKWRGTRGLTQAELSAKLQIHGCDISRGTLAKIEAGIRHISSNELQGIKAVLEITYDDFFTR